MLEWIHSSKSKLTATRGSLWLGWMLVHAIGATLGSLVVAPLSFGSFGLGSVLVGLTVAFTIACGQLWLISEHLLSGKLSAFRTKWILGSTLAGELGLVSYLWIGSVLRDQVIFMSGRLSESESLALKVVSVATGVVVFSVVQWLILRQYFNGTMWWMPIHLVGGLVGGYVALTSLGSLYDDLVPRGGWSFKLVLFNLTQLVVGLTVISVITGPVFASLMKHPRNLSSTSSVDTSRVGH